MANIGVVTGLMTKFIRSGKSDAKPWVIAGISVPHIRSREHPMLTFQATGITADIVVDRWAPGQICTVNGYLKPVRFATEEGPRFGLVLWAHTFEALNPRKTRQALKIPEVPEMEQPEFTPPPGAPAMRTREQLRTKMPGTFEPRKEPAKPAGDTKPIILE